MLGMVLQACDPSCWETAEADAGGLKFKVFLGNLERKQRTISSEAEFFVFCF